MHLLKTIAFFVGILVMLANAPCANARIFTDASGNFSVEAELIDVKGRDAVLKKVDGTILRVPIARLSKADQEYVAKTRSTLKPAPARRGAGQTYGPKDKYPMLAPSSGGKVYHVDADRGNDRNAGTERAPWKTLDRVNEQIGALKPGDAVLFQRGDAWQGGLRIRKANGTAEKAIVFGAYGPAENPKPSIEGIVEIKNSSHIVVRDLEIHGSQGGPGLNAGFSSYLQVVNNDVHNCKSNGIAYHAMVHHTATVDNRVWDIHANDGVSIHDSNWGDNPGPVGSHHWVIDNVFPGNYHEDAIDFATNQIGDVPAGEDVKIIGNRITGAKLAGVVAGHDGRYVWIIGNLISDCGGRGAGAIQSTGRQAVISGNVLYNNPRPVNLGTRGLRFHNNTLIQSANVGMRIKAELRDAVFVRNLVYPLVTHAAVFTTEELSGPFEKMDYNWYGYPAGQSPARFRVGEAHLHLDKWQAQFGLDANSSNGPPEGIEAPATSFNPPEAMQGEEFWKHFTPASSWAGCETAEGVIGAVDCQGKRQGLEILPFADYEENEGYGWPGTPIVRERYPLPNAK